MQLFIFCNALCCSCWPCQSLCSSGRNKGLEFEESTQHNLISFWKLPWIVMKEDVLQDALEKQPNSSPRKLPFYRFFKSAHLFKSIHTQHLIMIQTASEFQGAGFYWRGPKRDSFPLHVTLNIWKAQQHCTSQGSMITHRQLIECYRAEPPSGEGSGACLIPPETWYHLLEASVILFVSSRPEPNASGGRKEYLCQVNLGHWSEIWSFASAQRFPNGASLNRKGGLIRMSLFSFPGDWEGPAFRKCGVSPWWPIWCNLCGLPQLAF